MAIFNSFLYVYQRVYSTCLVSPKASGSGVECSKAPSFRSRPWSDSWDVEAVNVTHFHGKTKGDST
jgi:hypothetical protein